MADRSEPFPCSRGHPRRPAARIGAVGGADRHLRRPRGAGRLRPAPEPDVRGDRRVQPDGRGHRRRAQGDVRLPRQGRPPHRPAARGHRVGRAGLRRSTARPTPWKVWYAAPSFRYERAQAGRYRQHHQLGVEALGSRRPRPRRRGHRPAVRLLPVARPAPGRPRRQLDRHAGRPRRATSTRLRLVPRRPHRRARPRRPGEGRGPPACGCSTPSGRASQAVVADAPAARRRACRPRPPRHFERVQARPRPRSASPFRIEPRLVRGPRLLHPHRLRVPEPRPSTRAQNTIGGGGRYDGLAESLGGPPTPGHRLRLGHRAGAADLRRRGRVRRRPAARVDVFVVDVTGGERRPRPHLRAAPGRHRRRPRASTAGR